MIAWPNLYPRTLYVEGNYQENLRKLFEYMEEKNITGILNLKEEFKNFSVNFFQENEGIMNIFPCYN